MPITVGAAYVAADVGVGAVLVIIEVIAGYLVVARPRAHRLIAVETSVPRASPFIVT